MKMMKKVSLLIALALIVTIGGVYATWNYGNSSTAATSSRVFYPELTAANEGTSNNGTFIDADSSIVIKIDDTNNDYVTEVDVTGQIVYIFELKDGVTSMPNLYWQLSEPEAHTYEGNNVFNVSMSSTNPYAQINPANVVEISMSNYVDVFGDGTFSLADTTYVDGKHFAIKIDSTDIEQVLTINGTISLPTINEYNAFSDALSDHGNLKLVVSDDAATFTTP